VKILPAVLKKPPGLKAVRCCPRDSPDKSGITGTRVLPSFEIAPVLVRFDHVASVTVNANHNIMRAAEKLCVNASALAYANGARFCLSKPVSPVELANTIVDLQPAARQFAVA
jgi:hypothetical protein